MASELLGRNGPGIACREVTRVYTTASGAVAALEGVNAEFRRGEISAIVGPSGSGKSTLLRILAAIDRPTSGSILIRDRDVAQMGSGPRRRIRRLHIGYLYQDPAANLLSYMTVVEHIRFAAHVRGADDVRETADLMNQFGLAELSDRLPTQLSSGQQQLASLKEAELFIKAFNVKDDGNFQEAGPGTNIDENILHLQKPLPELSKELGIAEKSECKHNKNRQFAPTGLNAKTTARSWRHWGGRYAPNSIVKSKLQDE